LEVREEIENTISIAQLAGTRSSRTQCPFHHSESLDMQLFHEDNTWRCWGKCDDGKRKSIFDWVMRRDGIDFKAALHQLADEAGVSFQASAERVAILSHMQRFYHRQLDIYPQARAYLHARGFSDEIIYRYQLGYAPAGMFPTDIEARKLHGVGLVKIG
jgi:DNA primase